MRAPQRFQIALAVLVIVSLAHPSPGRQAMPSVSQLRLEQFLGDAGARADQYFELFTDLTAEETKVVEEFRGSGEISQHREIVSDLIVYRSQVDRGSISEYRDVKSVDGVAVAGREQRVLALFERGEKAGSARDELTRVSKEGSRYDLDHSVSGLTIGQALPLRASARAFFDFSIAGEERVNGRPVLVVAYEQVAPNPRFGFDLSLPSYLRGQPPAYRGRLWLDEETAQLWREVREVVVHAPSSRDAVVVQRVEFSYAPSRFEIPLPSRIVFGAFLKFSRNDGRTTSSLDYRVTFSYGEFRRFTTSSDEGQIARVAPDGDHESADEDLGPEFGPDAPMGPPDPSPAHAVSPAAAAPRTNATSTVPSASGLPASVPPPSPPVVSIRPPPPPPPPDSDSAFLRPDQPLARIRRSS